MEGSQEEPLTRTQTCRLAHFRRLASRTEKINFCCQAIQSVVFVLIAEGDLYKLITS